MDQYFHGQKRDIQFNNDGSLSHLNFEFKDPEGHEFCVCFDYTEKGLSPRSSKAWKLNHINKWTDPEMGAAEDDPWEAGVEEAEAVIKKHGVSVNDLFRYVLILERSGLAKEQLSRAFAETGSRKSNYGA